MDNIKELNSNSYQKNSKYHRHTGLGIRHIQKSRSDDADHNRKWRKNLKREYKNNRKNKLSSELKKENFKCQDKLIKSKPIILYY
tara:strand:+ start:1052 stop:1306 length:255 start_codon:yes stop_codon:yes gene_type:complete